jgi:hypothetical protein
LNRRAFDDLRRHERREKRGPKLPGSDHGSLPCRHRRTASDSSSTCDVIPETRNSDGGEVMQHLRRWGEMRRSRASRQAERALNFPERPPVRLTALERHHLNIGRGGSATLGSECASLSRFAQRSYERHKRSPVKRGGSADVSFMRPKIPASRLNTSDDRWCASAKFGILFRRRRTPKQQPVDRECEGEHSR